MDPRALRSILYALAISAVGCSGEDPPEKQVPTPEQVRDYFALNGGNCYRYRFSEGAATLFANVEIAGPNMTSVAGKTVYVRKLTYDSGGLPQEWFLDTESEGEVRLVRATSGRDRINRETRNYEAELPLFYALEFDLRGEFGLEQGDRFTTEATTPELCTGEEQTCAQGVAERHEWTVTSDTDTVTTPDGQETAIKLNYKVKDDTRETTEVYSLVPGKGVARFTNADGTIFQLCAWRVCDSAGACFGAESCAELTCN